MEHSGDLLRQRARAMGMFQHMGPALALLRSLSGKQQAQVAREAGLGKSQISKYEGGRELPKLESLGRYLQALGVTHLEFAYTLALVQQRAERLGSSPPGADIDDPALLLAGPGLANPLDDAMRKVVEDLLTLHRCCFETILFSGAALPVIEAP